MHRRIRTVTVAALLLAGTTLAANAQTVLSNGQSITPTAAPGSTLQTLNPGLSDLPRFLAGYATDAKLSPDGRTLLVMTGGYNQLESPNGAVNPADSEEYVFVYDVSSGTPVQTQVIEVPDTFNGITFAPDGSISTSPAASTTTSTPTRAATAPGAKPAPPSRSATSLPTACSATAPSPASRPLSPPPPTRAPPPDSP